MEESSFSQYVRPYDGMLEIPNEPFFADEHGENVVGYSIRVDQYRFTEWYCFNRTTATPDWSDIWGTELYNHIESRSVVFFNDENVNSVAEQPEMKSKIEELRQMIKDGWQAALPP